jgi:tetratricopeptide (TPR) repeat protein
VIATVRVGSNGSAEILSIDGRSGGWEEAFEREVQKSIAASMFESKCSGQKLILSYVFELKGKRGTARETVITRPTPNRVIVAAQPPATVCDTAARSDDDAEVFRGRSDWLLDAKRFPEALECAEASVGWKLTANAYINKAVALRKLKRLQEAVAAYDEAERLEPTNQNVHFNRANSYRDLGQLERAIQDYSTAIAVNTDFDKAYLNRGNIYLRLRRFDLALVDYSAAIELDPDANAYAYTNRCLVRNHLGDYEAALQDCDKAIQIDRSDPSAFNNRAGASGPLCKSMMRLSKTLPRRSVSIQTFSKGVIPAGWCTAC